MLTLDMLALMIGRAALSIDRRRDRDYHGGVLKVISAPELARNLDPILKALEETGTTLIVKHGDQPAALLVRFDAYVAMLATMDYSGWERWIDEVRAAFPQSVFSPPRRLKAMVPAFVDPADLGYAPQFGQIGSTAGRRRLAEELTAMGIQLEEGQLGAVYALVLSLAERKRVLYAEDLKLAVDEGARQGGGRAICAGGDAGQRPDRYVGHGRGELDGGRHRAAGARRRGRHPRRGLPRAPGSQRVVA